MKSFLLCVLIPILTYSQIKGTVVKVKDGDTVVVLDADNRQHTIRVADIDCPEYKQPYSKVAKWFTSDEIYLKEVLVKESGKDRYGRVIGHIYYDIDKNLSRELLKKGLAWHYKKYSKNDSLAVLEANAKTRGLGLWSDKNPIPPWDWRRNN